MTLEIFNKGLMFLTGILIIRNLEKTEYAWYTICNLMSGSLTNLSMLGLGTGMLAIGGERIGDKDAMGALQSSAKKLRFIYACISAPIVLFLLVTMLRSNSCPKAYIPILFILVLLNFIIQFNSQIRTTILQLARRYNYTQWLGLASNSIRLLCVLCFIFLYLRAWNLLLIATVLSFVAYFFFIKKESNQYLSLGVPAEKEVEKRINKMTLNLLPVSLMALVMPQISIWVLSFFGSADSVAEVGALGRLGLIISIPGAALVGIAQPWLAREQRRDSFVKKTIVLMGGSCVFSILIFVMGYVLTPYALYLLGDNYSDLEAPFRIYLGYICLEFLLQAQNTINNSKAWISFVGFAPIITLLSLVCAVSVLDISTIEGALYIPYFRLLPAALFTFFLISYGFRRNTWRAEAE